MIKRFSYILLVGFIALCVGIGVTVVAQTNTAASQSVGIAVKIALDKDNVPIGKSPVVVLTVRNLSGQEITIDEFGTCRLHVEGRGGAERPTTRIQRQVTGRLLERGEPPMREDRAIAWTISPGMSGTHGFRVSYFYDLSETGKHTVYMDVQDPLSKKWLRTNTVQFEMQPAATQ